MRSMREGSVVNAMNIDRLCQNQLRCLALVRISTTAGNGSKRNVNHQYLPLRRVINGSEQQSCLRFINNVVSRYLECRVRWG